MKTPQLTLTNHKTNTKYFVYYLIEVYATTISNFATWVATGADGTFAGQLVSPNSGTNENNGLANGLTTTTDAFANTSAAQVNFVKQGALTNDNGRLKVSFRRESGVTNTNVIATPTVAIQWKSDASPNWTKIPDNRINWGTSGNKVPSITWTTVVTEPVFPLVAIQAVIKELYGDTPQLQKNTVLAENQIQILTNYTWDKCTKLWNFVVNYKTPEFGGKGYKAHWTCTKNGDMCTQTSKEPVASILSSKTKLADWTKKNVTNKMIAAKSNAACGDNTSSGNGLKDITTVTPPKGDTRWNPPPHRDARGPSFGERVDYKANPDYNIVPAFSEKDRGRIFQDANSAAVLNKNPDKLKELVSAKGATNQWGFRFMYNPSTFGYQSSSNNSVDWTLGASDPATLLTGNSAVNVEVYINRIPDLKYLRLKNPKLSEAQVYGRDLTTIEKQGILNRGTEYDIEFLYRVLNGDPLKESLLLSTKYKGVTSDFGYTTGVPCWLVLNENLRYYGSVASFSVSHAMFDLNMVPMLSTVNITFARYPALWNETEAFGTGASVASTKEYLASTQNG
jgi:hypothetical protein